MFSVRVVAFEQSACSDNPDSDLIIILEESVREVASTDLLTHANLPEGWALIAEEEIPYNDVIADVSKHDYISGSNYILSNFDYRIMQLFKTNNGSIVLVYVDYFKNTDQPGYVLDAYSSIISRASNVGTFHSTGTTYGQDGITCNVGSERHLYFIDGKRFFMVYGEDRPSVETIGKLYASKSRPMIVNEKYHWMAKVCKSGTDECTKDIYYGEDYETLSLKSCKVTHAGSTTDCPESRIESYSLACFHSWSKTCLKVCAKFESLIKKLVHRV